MADRDIGTGMQTEHGAGLLEARLREWLAEEDRQGVEAREAAESYRGVDVDASVDMHRAANRHEATARRIRKTLGTPRKIASGTDMSRPLIELTPERVEGMLRYEWWVRHGCDSIALYGDDGEMSCGSCFTDFKRTPLGELNERVVKLRMAHTARQLAG